MSYPRDLKGLDIKKFKVLEKDLERSGRMTYWICQCECGTIKSVRRDHLISTGNDSTISCGCHRKALGLTKTFIDETGNTYNRLKVIKRDFSVEEGDKARWICECECGSIKSIDGRELRRGKVQSCGCIGSSIGEANIEKILKENHIDYKKEYVFDELTNTCGRRLRYDFALTDKSGNVIRLIEFDGRQHSDKNDNFYSEDLVKRDRIKDGWAMIKGIPMVRISYKYRDCITLDMLIDDFIAFKKLYDQFK